MRINRHAHAHAHKLGLDAILPLVCEMRRTQGCPIIEQREYGIFFFRDSIYKEMHIVEA